MDCALQHLLLLYFKIKLSLQYVYQFQQRSNTILIFWNWIIIQKCISNQCALCFSLHWKCKSRKIIVLFPCNRRGHGKSPTSEKVLHILSMWRSIRKQLAKNQDKKLYICRKKSDLILLDNHDTDSHVKGRCMSGMVSTNTTA